MRSAFLPLNIGSYGLFAAQQGLSVTANNITNANTVGYSRQVVRQKAGNALPGAGTGMIGTGVSVTGIDRIRNSYLDTKIWSQKPTLGEYRAKTEHLSLLEGVFGEPSDAGFTAIFNDVFKGLGDLSKLPDEGERKYGVMQSFNSFTQYFKGTVSSIEKQQRDLNFEVKNKVMEINMITRRVESLNRQIYTAEIHSGTANSLRDERELQIDRLAELINIEVHEYEVTGSHGQVEQRYAIKTNGQTLVDHFHSRELDIAIRDTKLNPQDVDDLYDVVWKDGLPFKMNDPRLSGELKGVIDMRDGNGNAVISAKEFLAVNKDGVPAQITIKLDDQGRKDFEDTGYITVQGVKLRYTKIADLGNGDYTFDIHPGDKVAFVDTVSKLEPVVENFVNLAGTSLEKTAEGLRVIALGADEANDLPGRGYVFIDGNKIYYTNKTKQEDGTFTLEISEKDHQIFDDFIAADPAQVVQVAKKIPLPQIEHIRYITITSGTEPAEDGYVLINGAKVNYTRVEKNQDGTYKLRVNKNSYKTLEDMEPINNPKVQIVEALDDAAIGVDPYTITFKVADVAGAPRGGFILVNGEKLSYTTIVQDGEFYKVTIAPEGHQRFNEIKAGGEPIAVKIFTEPTPAEVGDLLRVITIDTGDGADIPESGTILINGQRVKYTSVVEKDENGIDKDKRQIIIQDDNVVFDEIHEKTKPSVQIGEGYGYRGIPYYIQRLDNFVRQFAISMNGVYSQGVDENGEGDRFLFAIGDLTDEQMRVQLQTFIDDEIKVQKSKKEPESLSDQEKEEIIKEATERFYAKNLKASNFSVTKDIRDDASKILTTKDKDKAPGGNDLLLDLMDLKHDRKMFNEGEPNDYMISIFSELGINTKEANMYNKSQTNMVAAIETQRLSVSQVDQNEEMLSLVKYQQAYQAAARIISTMDTIYDITINRLGIS